MTVNDLGKNLLIEDCHKVAVSDVLQKYKATLKENLLHSQFEMMSANVCLTTSHTGNKGTRFWFVCPNCGRRVGVLLIHPLQGQLGCRKCLNLEYKKRRFKGMLESKII
ncbi:MAG: hypothetical protein UU67_C0051G0002 [Candidatus Daviesbacteria bacterium GW2011_GWB1_41_5]|uniref:Uncharacterized protein n=1 Tax=Candidatus Daviesbacteria bacterium GW2011_GWB1_41_5 TaxID=1618429 RepID=A0A0G0ZHL5_9BACT|nr:MAG: hypothetical protein UU67_C0051G0002 [Candidatus Daviesbacteria bacterium GW2011_GWB1_41_5]